MIQGQIMNIFVSIAGVPNGKWWMWEIAILSAYNMNWGTYNIFSHQYVWPNSLVEFMGTSLCTIPWWQGFDSPLCFYFNFNFFSPTGIGFYKTFSQKDLYLFFATLRIYIFVTNNNLVIGDWCELRIALIGHFQISHVLASQTCWVDSVYDGSFVQKLFSARAESSARVLKPNSINWW